MGPLRPRWPATISWISELRPLDVPQMKKALRIVQGLLLSATYVRAGSKPDFLHVQPVRPSRGAESTSLVAKTIVAKEPGPPPEDSQL